MNDCYTVCIVFDLLNLSSGLASVLKVRLRTSTLMYHPKFLPYFQSANTEDESTRLLHIEP